MLGKVKNWVCLFLVGSLVFSLAACGGNGTASADKDNTKNTTSATTTREDPLKKSYEISWVAGKMTDIEEGNYCQKWLEEKLNIKIKNKKIDINNSQQVDLMLASGEMPDCGWIPKSSQEMNDQKLIRTISKDFVKEYAPNYAKLLDKDPLGWEINLEPENENAFLSLSGYHEGNCNSLAYISSYRLDWLENAGIKPNGDLVQADDKGRVFIATEPFTQDQFVSIMDAFTKKDPGKNGNKDTFGMAACQSKNLSWYSLMGMFGIQDNGSVEQNGKAVEHYVSDAYKEFLKFANMLYKKGYVDNEFPTLNINKMWEKVESEKAGYSATLVGYTNASIEGYTHRPPSCMLLKNPNAKVLLVPPEMGNNGKCGTTSYTFVNYTYNFFVNKNVPDDKLAKILQMFDFVNFDKEAKFFLRYGEEGKHFTWSGTPNDSTPKTVEGVKWGGKDGFFSYQPNYIAEVDMKKLLEDPQNRKVADYARSEWTKYIWKPFKYDVLGKTQYNELQKKSGNTIKTLVDEFFYKAIVGEVNIETEWDKYIKQLKDAGYDKLEEELNKAPLCSDIQNGKF